MKSANLFVAALGTISMFAVTTLSDATAAPFNLGRESVVIKSPVVLIQRKSFSGFGSRFSSSSNTGSSSSSSSWGGGWGSGSSFGGGSGWSSDSNSNTSSSDSSSSYSSSSSSSSK